MSAWTLCHRGSVRRLSAGIRHGKCIRPLQSRGRNCPRHRLVCNFHTQLGSPSLKKGTYGSWSPLERVSTVPHESTVQASSRLPQKIDSADAADYSQGGMHSSTQSPSFEGETDASEGDEVQTQIDECFVMFGLEGSCGHQTADNPHQVAAVTRPRIVRTQIDSSQRVQQVVHWASYSNAQLVRHVQFHLSDSHINVPHQFLNNSNVVRVVVVPYSVVARSSNGIQRTSHPHRPQVVDVSVDHRCTHILMAHELRDRSDVSAGLQQLSRKRMSESMTGRGLRYSRSFDRSTNGLLNRTLVNMVSSLPGHRFLFVGIGPSIRRQMSPRKQILPSWLMDGVGILLSQCVKHPHPTSPSCTSSRCCTKADRT